VLDYAWWQMVVGEPSTGRRQKAPLHDILLSRPKHAKAAPVSAVPEATRSAPGG
jgi:hypothetical protein